MQTILSGRELASQQLDCWLLPVPYIWTTMASHCGAIVMHMYGRERKRERGPTLFGPGPPTPFNCNRQNIIATTKIRLTCLHHVPLLKFIKQLQPFNPNQQMSQMSIFPRYFRKKGAYQ
jgi:hypothetical protein